jgi:hypothetical protein
MCSPLMFTNYQKWLFSSAFLLFYWPHRRQLPQAKRKKTTKCRQNKLHRNYAKMTSTLLRLIFAQLRFALTGGPGQCLRDVDGALFSDIFSSFGRG